MYKTELCRNYEVYGICRYNERCQFAHSVHELRSVERHPRYKTEICKNFLSSRFCKYGRRCCFLHVEHTQDGQESSSKGMQSPCLKRGVDMDLEFQGIWHEEKDGDSIHVCAAAHSEQCRGDAGSPGCERASIGCNLNDNHALVWTKSPVFYIESKHTKYFERSAQNMAPGEPVLPACE
eukprot:jgi/Antlo1/87/1952